MIIQSFFEKNDKKNVIALGRFDGLHIGHQKVINAAKEYIKDKSYLELCMFTLKRQGGTSSSVLSFDELCYKAETLGVQKVVFADQTQDFFNISYEKFLAMLCENYNPQAIFVGTDYTFGHGKAGNADKLKEFCERKNIKCFIIPLEEVSGEKVSSSLIKAYLLKGEIERINALLGYNYFAIGEVVHGKHLGAQMGYPTANILIDSTKIPVKQGVYVSRVTVDGKEYKAISSFGTAPTFGEKKLVLESHILNFNEDIYGKKIIVSLERFLRENIKFSDKNQLKNQLEKDIRQV